MIICKFCFASLNIWNEIQDLDEPWIERQFRCKRCDVAYFFSSTSDDLMSYTIVVDDKYNLSFCIRNNSFTLRTRYEYELLLSLPFLPDITPHNAKEKIKTMLVFL